MSRAYFFTSSALLAIFTPPPLPRPPAWICAFTAKGPSPSRRAQSRAELLL